MCSFVPDHSVSFGGSRWVQRLEEQLSCKLPAKPQQKVFHLHTHVTALMMLVTHTYNQATETVYSEGEKVLHGQGTHQGLCRELKY